MARKCVGGCKSKDLKFIKSITKGNLIEDGYQNTYCVYECRKCGNIIGGK